MAVLKTRTDRAATGNEIRRELGDLDADTISAILETKISPAELVQVREWMDADSIIRSQLHHGAQGRVRAVCEILDEAEAEDER